ncbi:hypothetical protein J2D73_19965 [Acetobacter sacchari]|uniref:Uncharacterized protein n=1 Tax=Acetobacter sacchari TaxID=2661687 RepID=A0ABS3M1Q2_9PROT|nr:hypothetical protein [Acetobacter sacchari]MBO1362061.1 hypothetical protein [Acetobacter sacchari]
MARIRKAWRVSVEDYDVDSCYFAPNAGKARMACWRQMDRERGMIIHIKARRWREKDQELPERNPIADTLSEKETSSILHAFGFNEYEPWRSGYRDHYFTSANNETMLSLVEKGLMHSGKPPCWKDTNVYFHLTDLGKNVALSLVPEYAQ